MGFFGALYTGTAGMLAQSRSTSVISENIANINTTGYKRSDMAFHEMVATNKSTIDSNGSVSTKRINHIDLQGGVAQSSSATDAAIVGDGFFPVRAPNSTATSEFLYTRNGSFQPDTEGILKNSAGFSLYGWPITNGVLASGTTTASLQAIDVDLLQTQALPTSRVTLALNLDANETPINPHALLPAQQLPVSAQASHFSRGLSVFDGNGTERRIELEFRATTGPMAHFSSNAASGNNALTFSDVMVNDPTGPTPLIVDGDILQIADGTNTLNVTFRNGVPNPALNEVNTVGDLLNVVGNFIGAGGTPPFTASIDDDGEFLVQANDPSVTLDISGSSANVLNAGGLNVTQDPDAVPDYTYEPDADYLANGAPNPNQTSLPAFANTATPNPFHWWEARATILDPAAPSGSTQVEISKGLLNFDGSGLLNAAPNASGEILWDLGSINFDNASATDETSIVIDITRFTQFGGSYDVISEDQDGAGLGSFAGTQITREGIVQSIFTNGQIIDTYKIPLAKFTNPNGLERISGTAFAETENSGAVELFDPGSGGTGILSAAALETSNVDIADEFSSLIVNQRAFSLNSKIITTVDEMTQNLAQLKR